MIALERLLAECENDWASDWRREQKLARIVRVLYEALDSERADAASQEREACAKACDQTSLAHTQAAERCNDPKRRDMHLSAAISVAECAAAIRARKERP